MTKQMNIGGAVEAMLQGACVRRPAWREDTRIYIRDQELERRTTSTFSGNFFRREYIEIRRGDSLHPWCPTQDDILADDWVVV